MGLGLGETFGKPLCPPGLSLILWRTFGHPHVHQAYSLWSDSYFENPKILWRTFGHPHVYQASPLWSDGYFENPNSLWRTFGHPHVHQACPLWSDSYFKGKLGNITQLPHLPNLCRAEWQAARELARSQLVIKQADKGSSIVVEAKDNNVKAGLENLSSSIIYQQIEHDPTEQLSVTINTLVEQAHHK